MNFIQRSMRFFSRSKQSKVSDSPISHDKPINTPPAPKSKILSVSKTYHRIGGGRNGKNKKKCKKRIIYCSRKRTRQSIRGHRGKNLRFV